MLPIIWKKFPSNFVFVFSICGRWYKLCATRAQCYTVYKNKYNVSGENQTAGYTSSPLVTQSITTCRNQNVQVIFSHIGSSGNENICYPYTSNATSDANYMPFCNTEKQARSCQKHLKHANSFVYHDVLLCVQSIEQPTKTFLQFIPFKHAGIWFNSYTSSVTNQLSSLCI